MGALIPALKRRLRPLGRLRRYAPSQLVARAFPEWLSQLAGPRPLKLLRLPALALVAGDHEVALASALSRDGRVDEQGLALALIAEWESGAQETADRHAAEHAAIGSDPRLRAVTRFHLYLERPGQAQTVFERITDPGVKLSFDLAQAWRRHGGLEEARRLLDGILADDPSNYHALTLKEKVDGELSVLRWEWPAKDESRPAASYEAEPGRVLHVVAMSLPHHRAGSTYRTHYTLTAQRGAGIDAHVVTRCGFPDPGPGGLEEHRGIPYHRLPAVPEADEGRIDVALRGHVDALSGLVEELRPAILHPASDYMNATVAIEVGRRFGIPVLYEVRGFPEEYLRRRPSSRVAYEKWGVRRQIEAECWRRVDHIVTLADVMKGHIASKGVDPDRITVVRNAVDVEAFSPSSPDPGLRARLGIDPDAALIGYVSSLAAYEGIRYLIEAVAHLTYRGRNVQLLLVGDGAEREHLEQLARRLGVDGRTVFTGRVQHREVAAYYDLIDVFVVPRTSEATTELVTPLKPFEAMAMRKALIVSGTAALREMVVEGETALTFEPENAAHLADQAERLIDDPELRIRLGMHAREWVGSHRSWEGNVESYKEIYGRLAARTAAEALETS